MKPGVRALGVSARLAQAAESARTISSHSRFDPRHTRSLFKKLFIKKKILDYYEIFFIGDSGQWALDKSDTNSDPFERNQTDIFTFLGKPDLGELSTCRIEHDNKGFKSGWHLEHVKVIQDDKSWHFPCGQVKLCFN